MASAKWGHIEDYPAVRDLIADLVAEGIDVTVKPEVREVVEATARLLDSGRGEVRQVDLIEALNLDKAAISRRVASALDAGFLRNPDRVLPNGNAAVSVYIGQRPRISSRRYFDIDKAVIHPAFQNRYQQIRENDFRRMDSFAPRAGDCQTVCAKHAA